MGGWDRLEIGVRIGGMIGWSRSVWMGAELFQLCARCMLVMV